MNRLLRAFMLLVIIAALIVAGVSTALTNELTRQAAPVGTNGDETLDETEEVELTIEEGETVAEIAHKLRANDLIRNPLLFRFIVAQRGLGQSLQPGTYTLRREMSLNEIIEVLQPATPIDEGEGASGARTDEASD